ncbi:MAG: DNA mismatch repair protein MutS [Spirochaetes bacterium]|nr:DNA mismatch repair protein MutS [Spirochaetota bacterium]
MAVSISMGNDKELTPMMRQYLEIKQNYKDEILFFRLGDFYEMFFDDAKIASKILDIALTSRQNDIPMCGVPYHAAESYIARLIKAGYKVAICEQMEPPGSSTIVKREVIRVITPGTVIESNLIPSDENIFLGSVVIHNNSACTGFVDVSTGDFFLSSADYSSEFIATEISRFSPKEMLLYGPKQEILFLKELLQQQNIALASINEWYYDVEYLTNIICNIYGLSNIKGLGLSHAAILTVGSLLHYLKDTHKSTLIHLKYPKNVSRTEFMVLDHQTIHNLEILKSQDGSKQHSLFGVLNHTHTAMGKRTLERALLYPLVDKSAIESRYDIISYLIKNITLLKEIQDRLSQIHDIERLVSRFSLKKHYNRDFIALQQSIEAAYQIYVLLQQHPDELFNMLGTISDSLHELSNKIKNTIVENPPLSSEQGRVIKEGVNAELDRLYTLKTDARQWLLNYQEEEKKRLDIPTLKVRYNKVIGYYIEVSKGQTAKVPQDYFRKQTLINAERYTTQTLQKFETDVLQSTDRIIEIENEILDSIVNTIIENKLQIQELAYNIGILDMFCSLASAAHQHNYVRPLLNDEGIIDIKAGRHPVVEKFYIKEPFVPNDIFLDTANNVIAIITGPNMSGKSTYIRMAAIIQLMAQIGSFIPAQSANVCIVDRIFTRIGASDNIARGESTFLVEMNETAIILNNATDKSLVIMDEIGRGTSTYDGMAIAWAVVEYIANYIKAKTLFATHYHELTKINKKGIVNYTVMVKESINGVEFLHKVVPGAADKSYGIHVATLAGIPKPVTVKANKILEKLEKSSRIDAMTKAPDNEDQLEIFQVIHHRLVQALKDINIENLTPLEALNEIARLKRLIE